MDTRIIRFVNNHCETYFLYDFRRSDEFKKLVVEYAKTWPVARFPHTWDDADGKFSIDKFIGDAFPAEKEAEADVRNAFAAEFRETKCKFEDCLAYAEELKSRIPIDLQKQIDRNNKEKLYVKDIEQAQEPDQRVCH